MAPEPLSDDVLKGVEPGRRDFLKRLVAGTAFTVPLVASFSMDGLAVNTAEASCYPSYCSNQPFDGFEKLNVKLFEVNVAAESITGGGHLKLKVVDDGCTLEYKVTGPGTNPCHGSFIEFVEFFGFIVVLDGFTTSSKLPKFPAKLGSALDRFRSRLVTAVPDLRERIADLQTRQPSGGLSLPLAMLITAAGFILLSCQGRVGTGPGFDLTPVLEEIADGFFLVLIKTGESSAVVGIGESFT